MPTQWPSFIQKNTHSFSPNHPLSYSSLKFIESLRCTVKIQQWAAAFGAFGASLSWPSAACRWPVSLGQSSTESSPLFVLKQHQNECNLTHMLLLVTVFKPSLTFLDTSFKHTASDNYPPRNQLHQLASTLDWYLLGAKDPQSTSPASTLGATRTWEMQSFIIFGSSADTNLMFISSTIITIYIHISSSWSISSCHCAK